jgi:hypothetical protein
MQHFAGGRSVVGLGGHQLREVDFPFKLGGNHLHFESGGGLPFVSLYSTWKVLRFFCSWKLADHHASVVGTTARAVARTAKAENRIVEQLIRHFR